MQESARKPDKLGTFGTKPFAWETYATNEALNVNATGIHPTSPNRTNVFGGNAGTNNNNTKLMMVIIRLI
ncbi:MAG: hypothetical protein IPL04_09050 [Chitinophagaceae bacterium]|nr:hypothetical protein [Chitinophagaceae bacterium]